MSKKSVPKKPVKQSASSVQVQLEWASLEGIETVYVNHMTITHSGPEFYLVFGELPMPAILEKEMVPEKLIIEPRIRIAVTPSQMKAFSDVIKENVDKYFEKQGEEG